MPVCQMPFIIANEISEEEKTAWHNARLAEVAAGTYKGKEITPDFEPIEGWKPLKRYGPNPALIIREAAYDPSRVGIYPGDYVCETVLGTQYKFIIVKIGITPYNNSRVALMMADKPSTEVFTASNEIDSSPLPLPGDRDIPACVDKWRYQYSKIAQYCTHFYRNMPFYLQSTISQVSVPCVYLDVDRKKWDFDFYETRVFTPSVNEFCSGSPSSLESRFKEDFIPWPKIYQNSIHDLSNLNNCWLRTIAIYQNSNKQFTYNTGVTKDVENGGKAKYARAAGSEKHALLCFCIG